MADSCKWESEFGDKYQDRNQIGAMTRAGIWKSLLKEIETYTIQDLLPIKNMHILEVGCARGQNLYAINQITGAYVYGAEINEKAIKEGYIANIDKASAYALPYRRPNFDMVFTAGLLIHIPDVLRCMKELYRVSRKYILNIEYMSDKEESIAYRDNVHCAANNYLKIWQDNFDVKLLTQGEMKQHNVDNLTDDFSNTCKYILLKKGG